MKNEQPPPGSSTSGDDPHGDEHERQYEDEACDAPASPSRALRALATTRFIESVLRHTKSISRDEGGPVPAANLTRYILGGKDLDQRTKHQMARTFRKFLAPRRALSWRMLGDGALRAAQRYGWCDEEVLCLFAAGGKVTLAEIGAVREACRQYQREFERRMLARLTP